MMYWYILIESNGFAPKNEPPPKKRNADRMGDGIRISQRFGEDEGKSKGLWPAWKPYFSVRTMFKRISNGKVALSPIVYIIINNKTGTRGNRPADRVAQTDWR